MSAVFSFVFWRVLRLISTNSGYPKCIECMHRGEEKHPSYEVSLRCIHEWGASAYGPSARALDRNIQTDHHITRVLDYCVWSWGLLQRCPFILQQRPCIAVSVLSIDATQISTAAQTLMYCFPKNKPCVAATKLSSASKQHSMAAKGPFTAEIFFWLTGT